MSKSLIRDDIIEVEHSRKCPVPVSNVVRAPEEGKGSAMCLRKLIIRKIYNLINECIISVGSFQKRPCLNFKIYPKLLLRIVTYKW